MHRLRDDKSPTLGRRALYVSLGCECGILAALLWGPEQLTPSQDLLPTCLAFCLLGIGLYYLLFRRTGVIVFSVEARLQDQLTTKLLEGDSQMRRVAYVSRYDDWARILMGWSFASCGALWLTLPQLGQSAWIGVIPVSIILSILGLTAMVLYCATKMRLSK